MGEIRISVLLFVPFQNFVDLGLMNVGLGLGGPIIPIGIARGALVGGGADVVDDDDEEFPLQPGLDELSKDRFLPRPLL